MSSAKSGLRCSGDDDAPGDLANCFRIMMETRADIVGKRAHFMYLARRKQLMLRNPGWSGKYVSQAKGATLLVWQEISREVKFPEITGGVCVKFCIRVQAKGYRIYEVAPIISWRFAAAKREIIRGRLLTTR